MQMLSTINSKVKKGNYQEALTQIRDLSIPSKLVHRLRFLESKAHYGLKDYTNALVKVNLAIEQNTDNPWYYFHKHCIQKDLSRNHEAYLSLSKGAEIESSNNIQRAKFYYELALLVISIEGLRQHTEKYLIEAIKYSPGHSKSIFLLAELLETHYPEESKQLRRTSELSIRLLSKYSLNNQKVIKRSIFDQDEGLKVYHYTDHKTVSTKRANQLGKTQIYCVENQSWKTNAEYLVQLENGSAWSDGVANIIYKKNSYYEEISSGCSNLILQSKNLIREQSHYEGNVVYLPTKFGKQNYCHWLLDVLPRIELVKNLYPNLNGIDKILYHKSDAKYQQDTLDVLGYNELLEDTWNNQSISADNLIVPSFMSHPGNYGADWVIQFLMSSFLNNTKTPDVKHEYIYVSRRLCDKRRIINEEELEQGLSFLGFQTIFLEQLSIEQQATLFNQAKVIVAPHGAGLTNLVFCQEGSTVIEIFSPVYGTRAYCIIADVKKLNYYTYVGKDHNNAVSKSQQNHLPNSYFSQVDITVDVPVLLGRLTQLIKSDNLLKGF